MVSIILTFHFADMMWIVELLEVLILLVTIPNLQSNSPHLHTFQCPDVESCDCHKKKIIGQDGDVFSNDVECRGFLTINEFNGTSLQKVVINRLNFDNVTFDTNFLEREVFSGLTVESLKIKRTRFQFGNDSLILLKPSLRQLSLYDVGIDFKTRLDFLQRFSDLETLEIEKNGEFPLHFRPYVLENLTLVSLKKLTLRDCEIAKIYDSAFKGLPNLEILDLSHNKLSSIPGTILLLKRLRKIILSYNSVLYYIHDQAFVSLNKLEEIDISHTILNTIAPEAFYGLENSLKRLKLDHGELPYGPFSSLKTLRSLRVLDISYNKIIEMHNTSFEGFHSLEELDISGQFDQENRQRSFTFVDSMFRGVETTLKVLKIRHLGLEELPLSALSMLRLRQLDASENKFVQVFEDFFAHISAQTIILTDMAINEISAEAFGCLRGVNIIFDRNNITNISFINDVDPCTFNKLSFMGNPIHCDCDVVELVFTNRVPDIVGACADKEFRGRNLQQLPNTNKVMDLCDTSKLKKIEFCSYASKASVLIPRLQVIFLLSFIRFSGTI